MKYSIFFCLSTLFLFVSCNADKNNSINKPATGAEKTAALNKALAGEIDCYFSQNIQAQVSVKDGIMKGNFQVNTALENYTGTLSGKDYGEDFITDLEYKVGDKTHREKVIINIMANTMNFARSGMVDVDGERMERNGGESTLDELLRKPCK